MNKMCFYSSSVIYFESIIVTMKKYYYFYTWWIFLFFVAYKLGFHNYSPFVTYISIWLVLPFLTDKLKQIKNYPIFFWQLFILIVLDIIPVFFVSVDLSFKTILAKILFFVAHLLIRRT